MSKENTTVLDQPKVGSLVRLRSPGPKMTVVGSGPGGVKCAWFDGLAVQEARLPRRSLLIFPQ